MKPLKQYFPKWPLLKGVSSAMIHQGHRRIFTDRAPTQSVPTAPTTAIHINAICRRANGLAVSWGEQISYFLNHPAQHS